MRAFLVMLMLTLLPLQFSAASVLACHGHMALDASPHTGQTATAFAATNRDAAAGHAPACCLECGCPAQAVVPATAMAPVDAAGMAPVEHLAKVWGAHGDERPDRPQWPTPQARG
ncbi:hypothetical protein [Pantoea sp. 18069]|uniref:hypothetical protein n=1 Tax=Pantoea sp. 18069 TaxID=2681415 RepID=UPI00135A13C5|nr:hypothetical protein [Pantoea sp. 18069]